MSDNKPENLSPKRGRRPKLGPKRDHNMLIKLTEAEKARLWQEALSYEMTLSEFVRAACRDICDNGFSQPIKKL
jgi:hypothetical protein